MPLKTSIYKYSVAWSEEDQKYVGLCSDFPKLRFIDADPVLAIQGIIDLVKSQSDNKDKDS